jgi:hypothetical protein
MLEMVLMMDKNETSDGIFILNISAAIKKSIVRAQQS